MIDAGCTTGTGSYRAYGEKPYRVVAIHGGPGTPGSLGHLAKSISGNSGVFEPFQSARTICGQVEELYSQIAAECGVQPVKLLGHSWGAWLAFIFAAVHTSLVEKLILIGAGSFIDERESEVGRTRVSRLSGDEKSEMLRLTTVLHNTPSADSDVSIFRRFGELTSRADSYSCIEIDDAPVAFQPDVYRSVWPEAEEMRRSGRLLKFAESIRCPVVAIHGDHDPHPAEGVREPLARLLTDFRFILLERCGHYPWKERYAKDKFIEIINKELYQEPLNESRNLVNV